MQKQRSGFSLIFLIFLISTRQVAWQGYGNMSSSNLTEIWTFINNNIGSLSATSSYDTFNTAFSDRLNTIWAPAWNIFTIKTTAAYDTVLYGYAFNNHWMWFNDYQVNGVVLTFVIWKDYNCLGWKTVGKNGAASGLAFMITNFKTSTMSYDKSNLWQATKAFNHKFDNQPGAYSFVSSQDTFSDFYGRICVKSDNYFYSRNDAPGYWPFVMGMGNTWGNIFIFQTR